MNEIEIFIALLDDFLIIEQYKFAKRLTFLIILQLRNFLINSLNVRVI